MPKNSTISEPWDWQAQPQPALAQHPRQICVRIPAALMIQQSGRTLSSHVLQS